MRLTNEMVELHDGGNVGHYIVTDVEVEAAADALVTAQADLRAANEAQIKVQYRWDNDLCPDEAHWTQEQRDALTVLLAAIP